MRCPKCKKIMKIDLDSGGIYCVPKKVGKDKKIGCGYRWKPGLPTSLEIKTYSEKMTVPEIIEKRALSRKEIKKIDRLLGGI